MARNSLAGKSTGKSRSAKYLRENPEVRKKKQAYDKEYNKRKKQIKYRTELNRANRKAGTYGKMTKMGKDRSHTKDGRLVLEDRSKNRARNGKGPSGQKLK
jgi:hypothetical protein